jgi:hypothetical protein
LHSHWQSMISSTYPPLSLPSTFYNMLSPEHLWTKPKSRWNNKEVIIRDR